jgi:hypothetical protein
MSKSDSMWFCIKCRPIVEEHIVIDLKIEQRCCEIMDNYEQRLSSVERMITEKCSEHRAREIVRDEIKQFSCDEEKVRMIGKEESLNLTKSTTMCSSTIGLHLIQNHIESDLDIMSYSDLVLFRHLIQKWSLQR